MPPKKRRATGSSAIPEPSPPPPTAPKRDTWVGWCEVESEPAFFNTILHDIGVRGIKVQEVLGLDDELLAILPKPVHAVIFLFRYRETAKDDQGTNCPPNIWFANQVPEYACASVALLNIVMNIPNLELGKELERFKDFTKTLNPIGKGDAIAGFEHVRKVHNSFARENDMLNVDALLKDKHAKLQKKQKMQAANAARAAKNAAHAAEKAVQKSEDSAATAVNGMTRTNLPRRARLAKAVTETTEPSEDDAFHFIAYMPIDGEVWKLDGMDSFPKSLGITPSGTDWLTIIQTELTTLMLQYQEGQIEFSLMAVVQDPVIDVRQQFAENVKALRETHRKLDELSPQWKCFIQSDVDDPLTGVSIEFDISEYDIKTAILPGSIISQLDEGRSETLMQLRQKLIVGQAACRVNIRDQMQSDQEDSIKAMHRRHDYVSFVDGWLEALAEEDALAPLLENI